MDFLKIIDDTQGFDGIRVYDKYAPTLRASRSGLKWVYIESGEEDMGNHNNDTNGKYVIYDDYNNRIKADQSVIGTLTTNIGSPSFRTGIKIIETNNPEFEINSTIKVRNLTPCECFKLMGFEEEDCKKCIEAGVSKTQLYKQAGNSIVVDVLEAMFKSLGERYDEFKSVEELSE